MIQEIPFFSVALPVLNGEKYLAQALDSVLAQVDGRFELVVCDNGSTDESTTIVERYAARDRRIRLIVHDRTVPLADSLNRTVAECRGEWIKFFCHDDLLAPDCLSTIAAAISGFRSSRVAVIRNHERWLFGNGAVVSDNEGGEVVEYAGRDFVKSYFSRTAGAGLPALTTATVRREAFLSSDGFDPRYDHCDVFLWILMLMRWDYAVIPRVLTTNRIHPGQVFVAIRKNLKSIADHKGFFSEQAAALSGTLALPRRVEISMRKRWVGVAATTIAIQLLRGQSAEAIRVFVRQPFREWPLLGLLSVRSFMRERTKLRSLRKIVPVELLFPE